MGRKRKANLCSIPWSREAVLYFFRRSSFLDHAVLRPLSHVSPDWELQSDGDDDHYLEEDGSLAAHLNVLIENIANSSPVLDYHSHENELASGYQEVSSGEIYLEGNLWLDRKTGRPIEKDMVGHMIEQSTAGWDDLPELVLAAAGRVAAALRFGISHFDDLDSGHMQMLAVIMTDIIFRRCDQPAR